MKIGYYSEFKGAKTLLIAANGDEFRILADVLDANVDADLCSTLKSKTTLSLENVSSLKLRYRNEEGLTRNGADFEWKISPSAKQELLSLIDALIEVNSPGHQYFSSPSATFQLLLSKDEYSE